MSDPTIELSKFQCIDHEFTFEGTDLTGASFVVREAQPAALALSTFTLLAAMPGRVKMALSRELSASLALGGANYFRLEVVLPNGGNIALPKIGIKVT